MNEVSMANIYIYFALLRLPPADMSTCPHNLRRLHIGHSHVVKLN